MQPFATLADLQSRHPQELILLAADETTGLRDDARVTLALTDASIEVRAVLQARYTPAELGRLDSGSVEILRVYAMDVALYRIALAFSRQTEAIKERRDAAMRRLEAIAAGKGALTFEGDAGGGQSGDGSFGGAEIDAPPRMFPGRTGGVW